MKKYLLISIGLLLLHQADAQFLINPQIGLNFPALSENPYGSSSSKTGFQVGTDLRFGKKIYFEPGLFYAYQGNYYETDNQDFKGNVFTHNAKVPLSLGWMFLNSPIIKLRLSGGASLNYLMAVKENNLMLEKADFSAASFGTQLGFGADILFLTLDFGYEWGLSDLFATASGKQNLFTINMGLRLFD